ncbi:hypothetical protein [Aquimarina aquimarini]|uniref:hypothetical protein n=1 Tax=Aquimarina aquimarini TaxID=1191734 RepID=UPI000D555235|nr:hypothetical protein [Aquimarina aquimarini]
MSVIRKVVIIVILFLNLQLVAQEAEESNLPNRHQNIGINDNDTFVILNEYARPIAKKYDEKSITGSKYHEDDYKIAKIYDNDKMIHKYAIKYNAYADEIEVLEDNKTFALLKKENVRIVLDDYEYKLSDNNGYIIVFNKNKNVSLALKVKKKVRAATEPESSYSQYIPPSFVNNHVYYIKNKKGGLEQIKLKKKNILAVLKDKEDEVKEFASSKKLSFKKEADLVKIIDYYNTLSI